jgi:hypothetical protein
MRRLQEDLLATESNQLLRDWYRVHDGLVRSRTVSMARIDCVRAFEARIEAARRSTAPARRCGA